MSAKPIRKDKLDSRSNDINNDNKPISIFILLPDIKYLYPKNKKYIEKTYILMLTATKVCQTGNIAVNKAAKLDHLFSRPKISLEYILTSIQSKIKKITAIASKNISEFKKVYFTKR